MITAIQRIATNLATIISHRQVRQFRVTHTMATASGHNLPGFGLPLDYLPAPGKCFPIVTAISEDADEKNYSWSAKTLHIREVCFMKAVEEITNKPDWWLKVQNPEISEKWKKEIIAMDWNAYYEHGDFPLDLFESCLRELRGKADLYEKTGLIPVFDYSATVIKSDKLFSEDLRQALIKAVVPLENVKEAEKDWHPGSDGKVLDLVHPSLYPLVYGRSRILSDRRINVQNCLQHCGMGETLPLPDSSLMHNDLSIEAPELFSQKFQWLPCDVVLDGPRARIDSYVNNLHPVKHANLYTVIEQFIEIALPALDIVYRWPTEFEMQRLYSSSATKECRTEEICDEEGCAPASRPQDPGEPVRAEFEPGYRGSETRQLDLEWYSANHTIFRPDPSPAHVPEIRLGPESVRTTGFFDNANRLQVIVKLASIHLTPEKPSYDGGSWHLEGQVNEHICATALFYFDSNNITDSKLDFRTTADKEDLMLDLDYEQSDNECIERIFAIDSDDTKTQNIGGVLTRQGRALFFPNIFQHQVSSFELQDRSRAGHRKILALFLVDPAIPVISSANVPPQQQEWWTEETQFSNRSGRLPPELSEIVKGHMDFPISRTEALKLREELMAERTSMQGSVNQNLQSMTWNFCEH